jgi:hypothetical protein
MLKIPPSMRLVLWCPYVHSFIGATVQSKLLGQIGSSKYQWLQNLIRASPDQIYIYCDTDISSSAINHSDILSGVTDRMTRQELCVREAMMWAEINDLPIARDHFLFDPRQINSGDTIFSFSSYLLAKSFSDLAPSSDLVTVFSRPDLFKVVHLSHYIFNFEILVKNLCDLGVNMLCYESNLTKSRLFQRYAPQIREVVPIPFAVQDRFSYHKSPYERDRRCIATGGIDHFRLNPAIKEFFLEFSTSSFNPMRGLLYENQDMLTHFLVVNMSRFNDNLKETQQHSIALESWREALAGPSSAIKALKREPSYYTTSFVDLFNTHQLSYVSEEITHAPALGFFESMACGAIPIGIDNFIYNDIGLQPSRNYLPFDGSLGGLLATIQLVWQNPQIIEPIVAENLAFIEQHLRQDKVAGRFLNELLMRYATWSEQGRAPAEQTV